MTSVILVLNAGSSSIKFGLYGGLAEDTSPKRIYQGTIEGIGSAPRFEVYDAGGKEVEDERLAPGAGAPLTHEAVLAVLLEWIEGHEAGLRLVGAGHRVVHGGTLFSEPVRITPEVLAQLEQFVPLAPLHQPHELAAIRAMTGLKADLPQVACFDTAFHHSRAPVEQAFGLPRALTEQGIRRYGFHGLSYEYVSGVLPDVVGAIAEGRVVAAHLGNGASMCAMLSRKSVASTMGFTSLDGLVMGTRCGSLDPGVILFLMSEKGMDSATVSDLLYQRSGLLGVSGLSSDMRELLASDSPHAAEAIDLFVYRIGRELGSLVAALGGLDVLVFTAGIGEHSAPIRARVCQDARWLGVRLDEAANRKDGPRISADDSTVSVWVIPTNEELMIARHTIGVLGAVIGRDGGYGG
jgi:acetate kinase